MNEPSSHTDSSVQQVGTDDSELEYHLKDAVNSLSFNARVALFSARDRIEELSLSAEEKREIARSYVKNRSKEGVFDLGELRGDYEEKGKTYQKLFEELATHYQGLVSGASKDAMNIATGELDTKPSDHVPFLRTAVNGASYVVGEIDLLNALIGSSVTVDMEIDQANLKLRTQRLEELTKLVHTVVEKAGKLAATLRKRSLTKGDIEQHLETLLKTEHGKETMHQLLRKNDDELETYTGIRVVPLRLAAIPEREFPLSIEQVMVLISKEYKRLEHQLKDDIESLIDFGMVFKLPTNS